MARYKKINLKEYSKGLGNIGVFASYENNTFPKQICKRVTENFKIIIFNLRDSLKEELAEINLKKDYIYIDNTKRTDIQHIKNVCQRQKETWEKFTIIIDFENVVPYTEDELHQLKSLSEVFGAYIMITTNLLNNTKKREYPTLRDLGNTDLVDIADKVVLSNNEEKQDILAKNKFGKIGIIK